VFSDTSYPGDKNIVEHESLEGDEVLNVFSGKHWKQLTADTIDYHHDILPIISPEAFRFYLPAYLIFTLDNFSSDSNAVDHTVFGLCPPRPQNPLFEHFVSRMNVLTLEQKRAVKSFLELVKPEYKKEVSHALKVYWIKVQ
jgi:hypothetical protein